MISSDAVHERKLSAVLKPSEETWYNPSGRYFFNEKWSAEASYTFGDDNADSFRLGVAFHF